MFERYLQFLKRKKITSQFWIGTFDSEDVFNLFVSENDEFWSEDNNNSTNFPLSQFIGTQGQTWYDHDFIEAGYNNEDGAILDKFSNYSWADQWAGKIERVMKNMGIPSINAFIMLGVDKTTGQAPYYQVKSPCSHKEAGIDLIYVGEITHHDR